MICILTDFLRILIQTSALGGKRRSDFILHTGWEWILFERMSDPTSFVTILSHLNFNFKVTMEKAMAPHSSTLAWKIPWTEEAGGLQSMESLRVGHD